MIPDSVIVKTFLQTGCQNNELNPDWWRKNVNYQKKSDIFIDMKKYCDLTNQGRGTDLTNQICCGNQGSENCGFGKLTCVLQTDWKRMFLDNSCYGF